MTTEIETVKPFLSVVMPAYNEATTISTVVGQVLAIPFLLEPVSLPALAMLCAVRRPASPPERVTHRAASAG